MIRDIEVKNELLAIHLTSDETMARSYTDLLFSRPHGIEKWRPRCRDQAIAMRSDVVRLAM